MKRILLIDLAERERNETTKLRGNIAKTSSSTPGPADAQETSVQKKKKPAAKVSAKQSIDSAFMRRIR